MYNNHMASMASNRIIMFLANGYPFEGRKYRAIMLKCCLLGLDWHTWKGCNSAWHLSSLPGLYGWRSTSVFVFYNCQGLPLPLTPIVFFTGVSCQWPRWFQRCPWFLDHLPSPLAQSAPSVGSFLQWKIESRGEYSHYSPDWCYEKHFLPWF